MPADLSSTTGVCGGGQKMISESFPLTPTNMHVHVHTMNQHSFN